MTSLRAFQATLLSLFLFTTAASQAAEHSIFLSGLNVTVWSQATDTDTKQPVIIFSHGYHGCATQSRFLTEAFAAAGYIVFAPNHRDATCNSGRASRSDRTEPTFRNAAAWSENGFRDRAEDIRRLIDALKADAAFQERLDWSRLGLAGHSLGGYTVLGLAGAWPGWKLDGIKAVLALSPYTQPFIAHRTLGLLSAPVMFQGGTLDYGTTPSLHKAAGAYDMCPAPKYLVEFSGASHVAWTDIGTNGHEAIASYSLAFMDHYVRGEPDRGRLTRVSAGVSHYRYSSELGNNTGTAARK